MKRYTKLGIQKTLSVFFVVSQLLLLLVCYEGIWLTRLFKGDLDKVAAFVFATFVVLLVLSNVAYRFLLKRMTGVARFYECVLDAAPTPVTVVDKKMNNLFINNAAEVLCEAQRERFVGEHINPLWDKNISQISVEAFLKGKTWTLSSYKNRNYQVKVSPLGAAEGYVISLQDIGCTEGLFDAINASVIVTDTETNEIIFLSEAYKKTNKLPDADYIGQKCHVFLRGSETPCADCVKEKLLKHPFNAIEHEYFDPASNRYFKVSDSLTKWMQGVTAHTRRVTDITEEKARDDFMKKRLEQQELMTNLSLTLFAATNAVEAIDDSMKMTGAFLDAAAITLFKYEKDNQVLRAEYEWNNKNYKTEAYRDVLPFTRLDSLHLELVSHKKRFIIGHSNLDSRVYPEILTNDIKTFMALPLFYFETFRGVALIEYQTEHEWDRSDIALSLFFANILTSFFRREKTETDLMRMSSIANNSPLFISFNDLKGDYLFLNTGATEVTGYDYYEIVSGGLELLHGEEMAGRIRNEFFPAVAKHGKFTYEAPIFAKNGDSKMFSVSAFFIPDIESGVGVIATDITSQRRLEADLRAAKESAEKANNAKTEFLYRASHEIRTPITSIIGMTDIAKHTHNFAQISYCLEHVENASQYLLSVLNDVLDVSKIETNRLEIIYDSLNLPALIKRVTGMFTFLIDKNKLNLSVYVSPDVPEIIISDKLRISQILTNLLSNAVRYSPENSSVKLNASVVSKTEDVCELKIEVTDFGVVTADSIDEPLFVPLEKEGGLLRSYSASVIGLNMAKRIVELLGGSVSYVKDADGASFSFTLKAKIGAPLTDGLLNIEAPANINITNRYAGKRALLAEDVDLNSDVFASLLSDTGLEIDFAQNGVEAYSKYKENPKRYDVIVMDIHMPEMNGLEATKLIREINDPSAKKVPIIAFTADVFKEDTDKCLKAGMNCHIAKPMKFGDIIKTLDEFLVKN